MSSTLAAITSIYDERAPTYDNEKDDLHRTQATDYIHYLSLTPGLSVLDLACGTGGIAIPAAGAVSPTGKVIGVDISSASLEIAKSKARTAGLDVLFVEHDVSALEGIPDVEEAGFDVITCASALVLLENPEAAVRNWARFLKVGGKLVADVPTRESMIAGYILAEVGQEMGIDVSVLAGRTKLDGTEKVQAILESAGLDAGESFVGRCYREKELKVEDAGGVFDGAVGGGRWSEVVYRSFQEESVREKARRRFCEKFAERADGKGVVREKLQFCIAVGKKV